LIPVIDIRGFKKNLSKIGMIVYIAASKLTFIYVIWKNSA